METERERLHIVEMNCMKRFIAFLLAVMLLVALSGCKKSGEPDRLGSWGNINQDIERSNDWQQIVTNSPFQLGEKTVKGTWNVPHGTQDYYGIDYGTYPSIDGSTVALSMAAEFVRQHLGFSDENTNDFVGFSTTHSAYVNLITKLPNGSAGMIRGDEVIFLDDTRPVDLIIVTGASEDELNLASQHGVMLIQKPVCFDAFVFITHKNNPVDSLTIEQIRDIYSGVITNWKEVGGNDAPIIAYQREPNSGSQSGMIDLVMKDIPMLPPEMVEVVEGMGGLVEAVAEYKNDSASIGYTYKYYIDNLYKNENIKTIKIDGIPADEASIRSGSYPLSTCYYGVIRSGDESAIGGRFLDWILSAEGQRCVMQAGYIPYNAVT